MADSRRKVNRRTSANADFKSFYEKDREVDELIQSMSEDLDDAADDIPSSAKKSRGRPTRHSTASTPLAFNINITEEPVQAEETSLRKRARSHQRERERVQPSRLSRSRSRSRLDLSDLANLSTDPTSQAVENSLKRKVPGGDGNTAQSRISRRSSVSMESAKKSSKENACESGRSIPQQSNPAPVVPIEERPYHEILPDLEIDIPVKLLCMKVVDGMVERLNATTNIDPNPSSRIQVNEPAATNSSNTSQSSSFSMLANGLEVLYSAIFLTTKNADKQLAQNSTANDPLAQMFDDDPAVPPPLPKSDPLELDGVILQTKLPSMYITFSKPVPKPMFCEVDAEPMLPYDGLPGFKPVTFKYPEGHYFRCIEPTELQLDERVEYDMDELDHSWLGLMNEDRKKRGDPPVPELVFELIMDRLEKEWFNYAKDLPKPRDDLGPEESVCSICHDGEAENSNAIVFCDGCNVAVHQDCYGVPYIPEGQWLCRKCMLSPERAVSCMLCPNTGGAFKQTNNNKWAHVACAQWIPEASFSSPVYMEPIEVENIPNSRFKLTCFICQRRRGACIQCSSKQCYVAYHVTCARKVGLYMKMRVLSDTVEEVSMKSFCDKHQPKDADNRSQLDQNLQRFRATLEAETSSKNKRKEDASESSSKRSSNSKSKRHESETIDFDPATMSSKQVRQLLVSPIVPDFTFQRVLNAVKAPIRRKFYFIECVCRYWALKRDSRRGAPLLKRLHLEPWTAAASMIQMDESIKSKKFEFLRFVRNDLERVRLLAELLKKREKEKLRRANLQYQYFDHLVNPFTHLLTPILANFKRMDHRGLFAEPVDLEDVPDYREVIDNPMDFQTMHEKLHENEYRSLASFKHDIELICRNATTYNKADTPWSKTAMRILDKADSTLAPVQAEVEKLPTLEETGVVPVEIPADLFAYSELTIPPNTNLSPNTARSSVSPLFTVPRPITRRFETPKKETVSTSTFATPAGSNQGEGSMTGFATPNQPSITSDEELARVLQLQESGARFLRSRIVDMSDLPSGEYSALSPIGRRGASRSEEKRNTQTPEKLQPLATARPDRRRKVRDEPFALAAPVSPLNPTNEVEDGLRRSMRRKSLPLLIVTGDNESGPVGPTESEGRATMKRKPMVDPFSADSQILPTKRTKLKVSEGLGPQQPAVHQMRSLRSRPSVDTTLSNGSVSPPPTRKTRHASLPLETLASPATPKFLTEIVSTPKFTRNQRHIKLFGDVSSLLRVDFDESTELQDIVSTTCPRARPLRNRK